ncbi:MAG: DUF1801 domain-containing protein [Chloroherpetonaceae bacterium]|nr:DUF1801 domain-containing protein [Chloroherpetonaceae bacterium]
MKNEAKTPDAYIESLPEDRKAAISKLRKTVKEALPKGFEEVMQYGMISYVVPHTIFPDGYHTNPKDPLPFISIASQKSHIALYHMALYSDESLLKWFQEEYAKSVSSKLDMGKSCLRFKKPDAIPYDLIKSLATKITVSTWVERYQSSIQKQESTKKKK